jgi:hypothetical protein
MKALLVLSIIGIIICTFFFYGALDAYESAFIVFVFQYIFVIPHAIVSLLQSIKQKKTGVIIMTSIGFVLYFCGLFTTVNNFGYWNSGLLGLGYEAGWTWYVLSFLFFLSLAIVWIVLSVKFLKKKPKEQVEVTETNG